MPAFIRNTLFAVVMLCAMIIGVRVYLELDIRKDYADSLPQTGQVASTPDRLPHFVLDDVYGEARNIHEWSGEPLLINFWATWCAPCLREIPLLEALHKENSGIQVLGIAVDTLPEVTAFIGEYGVSYPNLMGLEESVELGQMFGLPSIGLPFSVLVAGDGSVLTVHLGEVDADQLAKIATISMAYENENVSLAVARERLAEI